MITAGNIILSSTTIWEQMLEEKKKKDGPLRPTSFQSVILWLEIIKKRLRL